MATLKPIGHHVESLFVIDISLLKASLENIRLNLVSIGTKGLIDMGSFAVLDESLSKASLD